MSSQLYAARYSGVTYSGIDVSETFGDISELKFRWLVPGGVQRIELTIPASGGLDAYDRYDNHLGHRLAIFDQYIDRPICSGQIFEVIPDGRHVTLICCGPWKRTSDDFYFVSDMGNLTIGTDHTDEYIEDILTDAVSFESADQSNIANSGVVSEGWSPNPKTQGTTAADAIKELAAIGDSSDNAMDFYYVEQPFSGTQMQAPLPYLKSRSTTADPDWIFSREDLAPNGLTLARNIWNLKTHVRIGYGRLGGSCTAGAGANLIDAGATFIADQVKPGDRAINITDNETFEVATVNSDTSLSFTDTTVTNWANTEDYSIRLKDPKWTAQSAGSNDFWAVLYREVRREMDETQALQYRDQLVAIYADPQQQQAFVISSPTIKDGNGAEWPLWRPFTGTSFYFRITDKFPEAAIFGSSDDRKNTFMAVAMDYTHSTGRLRIVPSTNDSRLDAMLSQAKIIQGQIVSTEAAWRAAKRESENV